MSIIKRKAVIPGQYYETTAELCGVTYKVFVYYEHYKGLPGNKTDKPEPPCVEITSIIIEIQNDFFEIETSDDWCEEMAEEILEGLL